MAMPIARPLECHFLLEEFERISRESPITFQCGQTTMMAWWTAGVLWIGQRIELEEKEIVRGATIDNKETNQTREEEQACPVASHPTDHGET
jgi:hypothetical protein